MDFVWLFRMWAMVVIVSLMGAFMALLAWPLTPFAFTEYWIGSVGVSFALFGSVVALLLTAARETELRKEARYYRVHPELLPELAGAFCSEQTEVRRKAIRLLAFAWGEPFGPLPRRPSPSQERGLVALYLRWLSWQGVIGTEAGLDKLIRHLEAPIKPPAPAPRIPEVEPAASTELPEFLSRPEKSASIEPDGNSLTNRLLEQLGLRRKHLWQRMGQALVDTVIDWRPLGEDRPAIAEEVEELPPIPPDRYVEELWAPTHAALRRTAAAINAAPTGRILETAEPAAGQALAELWSLAVEVGIQMRIDAADNNGAVPQGRWARGLRRMALGGPGTPISSSSRSQENAD